MHVTSPDGLAGPDAGVLTAQQALVVTLGRTLHQIVAEQLPSALVDFARSVNATQLVIGVSRRSRLQAFFGGAMSIWRRLAGLAPAVVGLPC
ncbi:hypothetical protein BH10ACT6_BH10ACT6_05380 [soil metagenome]